MREASSHSDVRLAPGTLALVEPLETRRLLSTVVVNTTADQTDTPGSGTVSLRDAVNLANAASGPTVIEFDPTVFATKQQIALGGTQLELSNTSGLITIQGPAAGVVINALEDSKVFTVDANVIAAFFRLTLTEGANPSGFGGAVEVVGQADFSYCNFVLNSAYDGGGIYNYGTLHLLDSTVADNRASIGNGGIGSTGSVIAINDTIYQNTSPAGTGGFGEDGTATLDNVTITDNAGADFVGGLFTGDGQTTITNTIVAGNTGEASTVVPDVYGTFTSDGGNLIGATDGSSGWISTDQTGTAASPLNAQLGPFQNNGGLTETLAPQPYSPALSGGSVAGIYTGITTDQRGEPRTVNGTVDVGAVEIGGTATPLPTTTTLASTTRSLTDGQSALYEITVTSPQGGTPTGTVTLYEQGNPIGTYSIGGGETTQSITPMQYVNGTDFTAVYNGDATHAGSTSNILQQDVLDKTQPVYTGPRPISTAAYVAGSSVKVSDPVKITNPGSLLKGKFTFAFDLTTANVGLDASPATLQMVQRHLVLKTNRSASVTLSAKMVPAGLTPGTYYFVAQVTDPNGGVGFLTNAAPITIEAPMVTLAATATAVKPATLTSKKSGTTVISIKDTGNINAAGTLTISLLPSSDGVSAASATPLASYSHRVTIKPGKTGKYTLHLKIPASLATGAYYPLASISLDGASTSVTGSPFTVTAPPAR